MAPAVISPADYSPRTAQELREAATAWEALANDQEAYADLPKSDPMPARFRAESYRRCADEMRSKAALLEVGA